MHYENILKGKKIKSLSQAIVQIMLIDFIFSIDSCRKNDLISLYEEILSIEFRTVFSQGYNTKRSIFSISNI